MNSRRYLLVAVTVACVSLFVLDPPLYFLTGWDVRTLRAYARSTARVVYMGDSVNDATSPCDSDARTVAGMLRDALGEPVFSFSHGAFTPIVYRKFAPLLKAWNPHARVAVIEINPRSFSHAWFAWPPFQFVRSQVVFDTLAGQFDVADYVSVRFGGLEQRLMEEYERSTINYGPFVRGPLSELIQDLGRRFRGVPRAHCDQPYDQVTAPIADLMAERFALHYGNRITADHLMFAYLGETVRRLSARGVDVQLYLTPINLEGVGKLAGPTLRRHVEANLALIRQTARKNGWRLLDLSAALSADRFIEPYCACEHVDQEGRLYIAQRLRLATRDLLGAPPATSVSATGD